MKISSKGPGKHRPPNPAGRHSASGAQNRKEDGRRIHGEPEDVTEEQDGGTMLTVAEILDFSEGTDSRP